MSTDEQSPRPIILESEEIADLPNGWRATMDTATLPDGRTKKEIKLHRSDSVHIIACTSSGNILLLREFRPFLGTYIWMLPSGKADKEADLSVAANRELREETGYAAKTLKPFCRFYLTDTLSVRNHVFIAADLEQDPLPQDDNELIEVHEVSCEVAIENVLSCNPTHAISAAALLRYHRNM